MLDINQAGRGGRERGRGIGEGGREGESWKGERQESDGRGERRMEKEGP